MRCGMRFAILHHVVRVFFWYSQSDKRRVLALVCTWSTCARHDENTYGDLTTLATLRVFPRFTRASNSDLEIDSHCHQKIDGKISPKDLNCTLISRTRRKVDTKNSTRRKVDRKNSTPKIQHNNEKFGFFEFCLWSRNSVGIIATLRLSPVNFIPKNSMINFFSTKKKFRPTSQKGRFPILRSNLWPLSGIEIFFFLKLNLLV